MDTDKPRASKIAVYGVYEYTQLQERMLAILNRFIGTCAIVKYHADAS